MTNENIRCIIDASRRDVLAEVGQALDSIDAGETEALMTALAGAKTIFCLGVGRVGLSVSAMVKRLNHLGLAAYLVGDLSEPAATPDDILLIASGSGETAIPAAIAEVAKAKGVPIAYIGSNFDSRIAKMAGVKVRIPVRTKLAKADEIPSRQIMSSLFEQALLLFADVVALAYARKMNLDLPSLWRRHANLE